MPRVSLQVAVLVPFLLAAAVLIGLWKINSGGFSQIENSYRKSSALESAFLKEIKAGNLNLASPQGTITVQAIMEAAAADRRLVESALHMYKSLSWLIVASVLVHFCLCFVSLHKQRRTE